MAFGCVLITPQEKVMDELVTQAIVPAHDGLLGILDDRAPLLVKLGTGPLRLDLPKDQKRYYLIEGGVAQVKDNKLTILTPRATPASQIDAEAARQDYAQALQMGIPDEKAYAERQRRLALARAKEDLAGRA